MPVCASTRRHHFRNARRVTLVSPLPSLAPGAQQTAAEIRGSRAAVQRFPQAVRRVLGMETGTGSQLRPASFGPGDPCRLCKPASFEYPGLSFGNTRFSSPRAKFCWHGVSGPRQISALLDFRNLSACNTQKRPSPCLLGSSQMSRLKLALPSSLRCSVPFSCQDQIVSDSDFF